MKTFQSGITGMGLRIRLDSKGIHFIKKGILGNNDDFYPYNKRFSISSTTSFIGITTIMFSGDTKYNEVKGFSSAVAHEIEELWGYGINDKIDELIDRVGIDGIELGTEKSDNAVAKFKAELLQKRAEEAQDRANEALAAQAAAANAAAAAASAYTNANQNAGIASAVAMGYSQSAPATPPPTPISTVYHVSVNGQQYGPYDFATMQQMAQAGQINGQSIVWCQGMPAWSPAQTVPELAGIFNLSAGTMPPPVM